MNNDISYVQKKKKKSYVSTTLMFWFIIIFSNTYIRILGIE